MLVYIADTQRRQRWPRFRRFSVVTFRSRASHATAASSHSPTHSRSRSPLWTERPRRRARRRAWKLWRSSHCARGMRSSSDNIARTSSGWMPRSCSCTSERNRTAVGSRWSRPSSLSERNRYGITELVCPPWQLHCLMLAW